MGKWAEKLTKDWGRTVDRALTGLRSSNLDANHSTPLMFEWLSPMFEWGATPAAQNNFISTNSQQRLILTGPGVCLPSGRWRILFEITLSKCPDVDLKIDLRFGDTIAVHRLYLVEPTSVFWLDIDHYEPSIFTFSVSRESEPTPGYIGIAQEFELFVGRRSRLLGVNLALVPQTADCCRKPRHLPLGNARFATGEKRLLCAVAKVSSCSAAQRIS